MTLQLEDLSLAKRLGILVLTVIAAVVLLLVVSLFDAEGQTADTSAYDERLVELDRAAIEEAYVEHIKKLFHIWVTDYSDAPPKATRGAAQARSAYARAMNALDKRSRQ